MSETYKQISESWLASPAVDKETKAELEAIRDDEEEIRFRFTSYLEFGTAGLRGIMCAGTNAMNRYTVAHATQGMADLILREKQAERGVVIGYDSRLNSRYFAEVAASVLAANDIKVYLFDGVRPTPELSFAIRELHCIAGINVTASHNPGKYNGYKAYWEDGAQLDPAFADIVSASIDEVDIFTEVKTCDFNRAVMDKKITYIGYAVDQRYMECVLAQRVNPEVIAKAADDLQIVYTPFHGAGYYMVPQVLRSAGVKHILPVAEQMILDGSFPTVVSPNPENPEGFASAIEIADKAGSDFIIGTDPDSDRTGLMVRGRDGKFFPLSGNQIGALLLDYIVTAYEEDGTMPPEPYSIKTIVTSEIITKICAVHNVKLHNVLTGFKFIGGVMSDYEEAGHGDFLFGFEESYGFLKGTYCRDKDAVVASLLIVEMASYYHLKGMTLADALDSMYERYGYYKEKTVNVFMEGLDGIERMKALMNKLRENPPSELAGEKIISLRDYEKETITNLVTGEITSTGLPRSNVLYYETCEGNVVVIRPSGTEPKIKLYLLVHGTSPADSEAVLSRFDEAVADWVK